MSLIIAIICFAVLFILNAIEDHRLKNQKEIQPFSPETQALHERLAKEGKIKDIEYYYKNKIKYKK